jgi:hypothetical protein
LTGLPKARLGEAGEFADGDRPPGLREGGQDLHLEQSQLRHGGISELDTCDRPHHSSKKRSKSRAIFPASLAFSRSVI